MPTRKQDQDFQEAFAKDDMLDIAIEWISANLSPDEVFNTKQLETWATENGFVKDE